MPSGARIFLFDPHLRMGGTTRAGRASSMFAVGLPSLSPDMFERDGWTSCSMNKDLLPSGFVDGLAWRSKVAANLWAGMVA